MAVTADDLAAATAAVAAVLIPAAARDWSAVPGTGDWSGWHTAEHIGDCLLSYAAQIAVRPGNRYVRFEAVATKDASSAELLEFAMAGGHLLGAMVRTADPQVRAYHPTGISDPAGFAGMGCVEMLVHGHDIARGLELVLDPPRDVCARVLARLFPHTTTHLTDLDPWQVLLWATNRLDLPGQEPQVHWRWRGTPAH